MTPPPLPPVALSLHVDRAPFCAAGLQHLVARVTLPAPWGDVVRPPLRLVLALDRSSSMRGRPLAQAKAAALATMNALGPEDELAVVSFDDRAVVHAPPRACRPSHLLRVVEMLDRLSAGRGTALFDGWRAAVRAACEPGADGAPVPRQRHVIVLSDGHPNGGLDDPDGYGQAAALALGSGVATSAVGIGSDYHETLLARLTRRGSGRLHDAERVEDVLRVVRGELDLLRRVAVHDAVVTLPYVDGVTLCPVPGLPSGHEDGALKIELGALGPGERRSAVVAVDARGAREGLYRFAARLTARPLVAPNRTLGSRAAVSVPLAGDDRAPVVDLEAAAAVLRHRRNRAIERAGDAKRRGDLPAARRILSEELTRLREMPAQVPDRGAALRVLGELLGALDRTWIRRSGKAITSAVTRDLYGVEDPRPGAPGIDALCQTLVRPTRAET